MDVMNVVKEIARATEEEVKNMEPINIMLVGKTGVGKSTLINSIFRENLAETGVGRPVTEHLEKITKEGIPLTLYDTRGLELSSSIQRDIKKEILTELKNINTYALERERVHVVWYCIHAGSNRLEDLEEEWIRDLSERVPVVLVLTQSIQKEAVDVFLAHLRSRALPVAAMVPVIAAPFHLGSFTLDAFGLDTLLDRTLEKVPKGAERALINAQKVDIGKKAAYARKWAKGFIGETFLVGFTPIPFADAPILASSQVAMIAKITSIFGVSMNKALLTSVLSAAAGVSGAVFTGRTLVSNLFKLFPGAGTVMGGIISGSTAALITTGLAHAYINVMTKVAAAEYQGGTMEESEVVELMKKELKRQLEILSKKKETD